MELQSRSLADYGAIHSDLSTRPLHMDNRTIEHAPDKYQPPFGAISRKSSTTVGIVNILCTSLDGTALTIPYAMWKCGIFCGTLILMGYAIGTALTLQFICISARKLRAASYTEIVHRLFGQTSGLLFSGVLFLVLFAILVGFLILMRQIVSDLLVLMAGDTQIPPLLVMVLFSLLCLPFMLAESLHKLRYSCYLGFGSIVLVLGCLTYAVEHPSTQYRVINFLHVKYMPDNLYDLLEAIPVFTMLYISHFNVLGVFTQLENPTPNRMSQVICSSVLIMTALFAAFGIVGYFVFFTLLGGQAVDNILRAFPPHHRALLVGRVSLLVTLICTLPVMLIPARSILMEYYEDLLIYWQKQSRDDTAAEQQIVSASTQPIAEQPREPYIAAAGSIAPLSRHHSLHEGYSTWLDGTLFANRTHHADHVPSPSSLNDSNSTDTEMKEDDIEMQRLNRGTQETPAPVLPHALESPDASQTVATADEGDVGVGFEGLESHWRDWQALVAPLHSLDPRGRSAFQQELDEAERQARAAAQVQQAESAVHDRETESERLLGERKAMEESKGAVEMVSLQRSTTVPAAPTLTATGIASIFKWRCLRIPHGGEAAQRQWRVRYTLTVTILALVLLTASVVPDSVSKVWQVAGSSVGMLISFIIPSLVYLKLRHFLHAQSDIYCTCAWCILYITTPLVVLCSIHNIR